MDKKISEGRTMFLLLTVALCFPVIICAETITLKSGQEMEGKIIENTDKYIKIDFEGIPLTYFLEDIESIDGNKIGLSKSEEITNDNKIPVRGDIDVYLNNEFRFRMRKISGWDFKEFREDEKGISMLSLAFEKSIQEGNFKNAVIINVSLVNKLNVASVRKGEEFISYADNAIDSAARNLSKLSFNKETISINNIIVRKGKFEWLDKQDNNKYITELIFFEPTIVASDIINVFILVKCKSDEYHYFQSNIDDRLRSIEIR